MAHITNSKFFFSLLNKLYIIFHKSANRKVRQAMNMALPNHPTQYNQQDMSVANREESKISVPDGQHPLQYAWSFWFMHRAPGQKVESYESGMIKIATFATVESFWAVYGHLKRPNQVSTITDYHMFRAGMRPVWEDPANISGGKWMIRLRKGLAPRLWERLAMAVVGNMFDYGGGDQICGIVLSVRNSEDIVSLWTRSAADTKTNGLIRDGMKAAMVLPDECIMEYKVHNDSMKDNSSSRNTEVHK